jgi:hypothetical protein
LSVRVVSSTALPRIVGSLDCMVACAKEYSWYPRYAGQGGLLGSTYQFDKCKYASRTWGVEMGHSGWGPGPRSFDILLIGKRRKGRRWGRW